MSVDEIVQEIAKNMANDGSANYIQLTEQLGIVGTIAEVILGLLVTIILIGVPIVVAIELLYVNFPILQDAYEKMMIKTTGKVNQILGLVIRDARLAVKKANTIETGRSVNWIYFKMKCKAIFLAVLTVGLVLGAGPAIIQLIVEIAKSIIEGFKNVF